MPPSPFSVALAAFFLAVLSVGSNAHPVVGDNSSIFPTIASFNIQIFGQTKMSYPQVVADIVTILETFDFVAIMEIRDDSGTALPELVDKLNEHHYKSTQYVAVVGPREGDSFSKEQYAFVYRPSRVRICSNFTVTKTASRFSRPPLVAVLDAPVDANAVNASACGAFMAMVLHARPGADVTYLELDALADAYTEAAKKTGISDAILMGDFNADCSYLPAYRRDDVTVFNAPYDLLINESVVTTVTTPDRDCVYDRFVTRGDNMGAAVVSGSPGVVNVEKPPYSLSVERTRAVSDHYPIRLQVDFRVFQK